MTYGAYAPFFNGFGNQTQGGNDLIWVQGEAGARAYMVAPGRTVLLSLLACLLFTSVVILLSIFGVELPDTLIQYFFVVFGTELAALKK